MKLEKTKIYEDVEAYGGGTRPSFRKMVVETDAGLFDFGEKCGKCGSVFVPRIYRKDGELVSTVWCPTCKE